MRGLNATPEYLKTEDYVLNMEEAMDWKVVLFDSKSRQHWLADGASVVLHLCRAWLSSTRHVPTDLGDVASKIWTPPSAAGPDAAFNILRRDYNRSLLLYPSDFKVETKDSIVGVPPHTTLDKTKTTEWYLLQHKAQYFFHWLEQIRDRNFKARDSADIDLGKKVKPGPRSIGFEFKDLISSKGRLNSHTIQLEDGAKAWLEYTSSVDAIHIHGSGFGDLTRPTNPQNQQQSQCSQKIAAPTGRDYLMAPLSVLSRGLERFEHTETCAQLATDVFWWAVNDSFAICTSHGSRPSKRCKAFIGELHRERPPRGSGHDIIDDMPAIFENFPSGAIIIGGEQGAWGHLLSSLPSIGSKRRSTNEELEIERHAKPQGPQFSDSAYGSNVGDSSSHGSRPPNRAAITPVQESGTSAGAPNSPSDANLAKRRRLHPSSSSAGQPDP